MRKIHTLLALALVLATLMLCMVGCAAPAETTSENPATSNEKMSIALLLPGSMNDGSWCSAAYAGLMNLEKEGYTVAFTENIAVANIEEAMRNYANEGFGLIIGHGFEFGEPALRVAEEFPQVSFYVSGQMPDGATVDTIPNNTGFMDMKEYEAAFLTGIVAGGVTESNILGYVAGLEIPSQLFNMAGFVQGVAYSNPDAKVYGVVTGDFEDAAKGKEAAMAQIDMGADVIAHSANTTGLGVIEACVDRDVYVVGYGGDQSEIAPDNILTSFYTDNQTAVALQASLIEEGNFGGLWEPGVADGVCLIADYKNQADVIPQETKDLVEKAIEDIKSGDLVVERTTDRLDEKIAG